MECDVKCLSQIHKKLNQKPRKPRQLKDNEIFELKKHISNKPHTKKETKIIYNEMLKGKSVNQAHEVVNNKRKNKKY